MSTELYRALSKVLQDINRESDVTIIEDDTRRIIEERVKIQGLAREIIEEHGEPTSEEQYGREGEVKTTQYISFGEDLQEIKIRLLETWSNHYIVEASSPLLHRPQFIFSLGHDSWNSFSVTNWKHEDATPEDLELVRSLLTRMQVQFRTSR